MQYLSIRAVKRGILGLKKVVVDLRQTAGEHHFLDGLKDGVTSKKTPEKMRRRLLWKLFLVRVNHPQSSMTYLMLTTPPSTKIPKKPKGESSPMF